MAEKQALAQLTPFDCDAATTGSYFRILTF
jgi:hypothetical protein